MFLKELNDEMNITRANEFTDSILEAIINDDDVRDLYMDQKLTPEEEEKLAEEDYDDDEDDEDESDGDELEDVYDEEDIIREN